jgi:hypothetical protein
MAGTHQNPTRGTAEARSSTSTSTTSPSPTHRIAKSHPVWLSGTTNTPVRVRAGVTKIMAPLQTANALTCLNRPGTSRTHHVSAAS